MRVRGGSSALNTSFGASRRVSMTPFVLLFLLFVVLPAHFASALTETLNIVDDIRSAITLRSFGFRKGGFLNVTLTNHELAVPPDLAHQKSTFDIGLLIERTDTPAEVDMLTQGTCLHKNLANEDSVVVSLESRDKWADVKYAKKIEVPGYYHIYYSNCEPNTLASFKVSIIEHNPAPGGGVSYLSVGEEELPTLYFVFFVLFAVEFAAWILTLVRRKEEAKLLHILMTAVITFKLFSLLFEAFKYNSLSVSGHNNGWAIAYYVFNTIRGLMMFAVIILAGTGWSSLRPFLTERDKQFVFTVLVVQLLVNAAWITVQVTEPGYAGWLTWQSIFHIMDFLCCFIILFPIYWSVQHLEREAETDGRRASSLERLKNFRRFYFTVVIYLYATRVAQYFLETSLVYSYTWVASAFRETVTLAFFAAAGYIFRPQPLNPYLALEADDEGLTSGPGTAIAMGRMRSKDKASSGTGGGAGAGKKAVPAGGYAASAVGGPGVHADDDFDDEPLTDADAGPRGALGGTPDTPDDDLV